MHFSNPFALILLFSLPVLIYLGPSLRGAANRREKLSVTIRLIILISLIMALAGLETVQKSNRLAVVFVLDGSDSISSKASSEAEAFIQTSLEGMGPDDQAGVIVFGKDAVVERPLSSSRELGVLHSIPGRDQTDLEDAIRLALALLPQNAARRIVILSDGVQTSGDAENAVRLAAASGVQVVAVPLLSDQEAEAFIRDVTAPSLLREGEKFDLQLTIEASQPGESQVRVFANGQLIYQGSQKILRGQQIFSIPLQAGQSMANSGRFIRYQVQIDPQYDSYFQNNQVSAYSKIEGPPSLLMISPPAGEPLPYRELAGSAIRPDEAAQLYHVLDEAGFQVQVSRPSGLPGDLAELANYDAIIIVDVPARELTGRQMEALQGYVRDLGGGLMAVGGPTSFGVGGYYRTPLEEVLPVEMQMKDQLRRPTLTMIFVIDHSGSMGETSGGVSKLELAKEATIRSIELLNPADRVGVVAFDDSATWVVPITDVNNPDRITNRIGTLRDGGGTDILAGLQAMAQILPADPATVKHVILLTDGGANPTGIPELVARMNEDHDITLTTVGIGSDAAPYLANLAELGAGRYHFAADPGSIPRIFTEETSLAARSYIIERTFTPVKAGSANFLTGLPSNLPALWGYVGTTARSVAQTILVSDLNDPILATWQYGLGRTAAFTSDASGRWAGDWVEWQGFATFWTQIIQFLLPIPEHSALTVRVGSEGENASLTVDAQSEAGVYLNNYELQANIAAPDGEVVQLELFQIAPGQYQGTFSPQTEGAYILSLTGQAPDTPVSRSQAGQQNGPQTVVDVAGWVRSYAPEYRQLNHSDSQELAQLANLTGGWVGSMQDTDRIFTHDIQAGMAANPTWPWLLALAAVLLPFDIAVRRLALTPGELRESISAFGKSFLSEPAREDKYPARQHNQSMTAYMRAKQRTEQQSKSRIEQPKPEQNVHYAQMRTPTRKKLLKPESVPFQGDQSNEKKDESGDPSTREATTAASLLAAKRKRNKQK